MSLILKNACVSTYIPIQFITEGDKREYLMHGDRLSLTGIKYNKYQQSKEWFKVRCTYSWQIQRVDYSTSTVCPLPYKACCCFFYTQRPTRQTLIIFIGGLARTPWNHAESGIHTIIYCDLKQIGSKFLLWHYFWLLITNITLYVYCEYF